MMRKTCQFTAVVAMILAMILSVCSPCFAEEPGQTAENEGAYVPERYHISEINWGSVKVEQTKDDAEYKATYKGGKLSELEVEVEREDGTEYEVVFDSHGRIIRAEYESGKEELTYDGKVWRNKKGKEVKGPSLSFMKKYFKQYKLNRTIYLHNTMSVVGMPLRDLYPGLTDKWYHVLPVDLTKDGVIYYQTAVSNTFWMGYVKLTIQNGTVTTDFAIPYGDIEPEEQCLAWFTSIDEITTEFLNNPKSDLRFGQPVDIQKDLKGQDIALLFICNHLTYKMPIDFNYTFPARFFPKSAEVKAYEREVMDLFNRMQ